MQLLVYFIYNMYIIYFIECVCISFHKHGFNCVVITFFRIIRETNEYFLLIIKDTRISLIKFKSYKSNIFSITTIRTTMY